MDKQKDEELIRSFNFQNYTNENEGKEMFDQLGKFWNAIEVVIIWSTFLGSSYHIQKKW